MTKVLGLKVRVWVPEVWDTVELELGPAATVGELKTAALFAATGRARPAPAQHVVKYRGAPVLDEGRSLAELGVRDGAPFIVLPAQRQPVR